MFGLMFSQIYNVFYKETIGFDCIKNLFLETSVEALKLALKQEDKFLLLLCEMNFKAIFNC